MDIPWRISKKHKVSRKWGSRDSKGTRITRKNNWTCLSAFLEKDISSCKVSMGVVSMETKRNLVVIGKAWACLATKDPKSKWEQYAKGKTERQVRDVTSSYQSTSLVQAYRPRSDEIVIPQNLRALPPANNLASSEAIWRCGLELVSGYQYCWSWTSLIHLKGVARIAD